ncbi:MAG: NAD(+) synthase, partial [Christensenellaceae bacterium]|nr:NAD(+) synthase [Christensenellaceae bacterium]
YENSQARERTQTLMDYANMVNGLVLGTGDLSEISLGWNTYNGDHMSMYNVNCSVPKTLIPLLINHIAKSMGEDIYNVCLDVINTPISPELLPSTKGDLNQKTEEIIGDYNLHDFFIFNFIDSGSNADRLYVMAKQAFEGMYDEKYIQEVLNKFIRRFFSQQFKRNCSPDGPAIGPISLSPRGAWQMPSDMYSSLWDSVNLSLNDEEFKA